MTRLPSPRSVAQSRLNQKAKPLVISCIFLHTADFFQVDNYKIERWCCPSGTILMLFPPLIIIKTIYDGLFDITAQ